MNPERELDCAESSWGDPRIRRLMVFSHPGHELAAFGLVQRLKPDLLYLTDGGAEVRAAETRRALESIGAIDRARFAAHGEQSFYAALVERDGAFFRRVAAEVGAVIDAVAAEQVFCDAVEFYNPVHDLALPLALAALRGGRSAAVFEVPVVYQKPGPGEVVETHRFPDDGGPGRAVLRLSDEELRRKLRARDEIYHELGARFAYVGAVSPAQAAVEVVRRSNGSVPTPDASRVLRYEQRGRLLEQRGEVEEVITYAGNYLPILSMLGLGEASSP